MLIILIAGASGAGKSTIARALLADLNEERPNSAELISMDNYYHGCPEGMNVSDFRQDTDFSQLASIDEALLLEHLRQLHAEQAIEQPLYDFTTSMRTPEGQLTHPTDVVIVEGMLAHMLREKLTGIPLLTVDVLPSSYTSMLGERARRDIREGRRTPQQVNRREEHRFLAPAYFTHIARQRHNIDVYLDPCNENIETCVRNVKTAMTPPTSMGIGL